MFDVREDGFREFVAAATAELSRSAYLLTGDHHLAQDLLQSALANTYRHWRRVKDGNPRAYVRKAMHREQLSWWRRRRLKESPRAEPPDRASTGPDHAEQTVLKLSLDRALASLSPRQRAVIILRHYEDLTEAETATVLGCTVGTVKRHGHDAMIKLRETAPILLGRAVEVRK